MKDQSAAKSFDQHEIILRRGAEVIRTEAEGLRLMADQLGDSFVAACEAILASSGRVVVTGMGKSGHIGRKWASTMAATGTPAIYIHPAEASHGDLGMLVDGDVLIVISNSGNTSELRSLLRYARDIGVRIIGVGSRADSLVMKNADVLLRYPAVREACPANIAPTTSTTLQLALGDALAMALMDQRGFSLDGLKKLHPGGSLGLRMTPIAELMHDGDRLPLVGAETSMQDVVVTMTSSGFGIAGVVNAAGGLIGVITDGDLRRHFAELGEATAADVMSASPKMLAPRMLCETALQFFNENGITAAFVVEPGVSLDGRVPAAVNRPIGIIHIHDFVRIGLG